MVLLFNITKLSNILIESSNMRMQQQNCNFYVYKCMSKKDSHRPKVDTIVTVPMDYHSSGITGMCLIVEIISDLPTASYITKIPQIPRNHKNIFNYYWHIMN